MKAEATATVKTPTAAFSATPDTSAWQSAGRNIKFHTVNNVLFVAVDTSPKAFEGIKPTDKGNVTIASTLGNIAVSETLKMGVNIYGKPPVAV